MRYIVPFLISFVLFSCVKSKVLPEATNSAQNTFGYLNQDSAVVGGDKDGDDEIYYTDSTHQFRFILRDHINVRHLYFTENDWRILDMSFHFVVTESIKKYYIDSICYYEYVPFEDNAYSSFDSSNVSFYKIDTSKLNYVAIYRSDLDAREISGKFEFNLAREYQNNDTTYLSSTQIYHLKQGRFDLSY